VRLILNINPTRFAAFCQRFDPSSVADLQHLPAHQLLFRDPQWERQLKDEAPASWDNYIPASTLWITRVTQDWQTFVDFYVAKIVELITEDFNARATPGIITASLELQAPASSPPAMPYAEVHWEFVSHDARLSFSVLERKLRMIAPNYAVRQQVEMTEHGESAARWISVQLREGITLVAYTKLASRIRLELQYNGTERTIGDLVQPSFRFTPEMPFSQRLENVRRDGAQRLNLVLAEIPNFHATEAADEMAQLAEFLSDVSRLARNDRAVVRELLSQLVADGAISARPRTTLSKVADALERAGAVRRVSILPRAPTRRYLLSDPLKICFGRFRSSLTASLAEAPEQTGPAE
jgi:hypothetical protein